MTTLIFGHRGVPAKLPENSLAGFAYAISHDIDGLEFDVQLTADGIPVVMHDERLNRTTDGHGLISSYRYDDLRRFCLSNGERIPTLQALLKLVGHHDVILNLEFKTNRVRYPGIEKRVLDIIKRAPLKNPVIFSSFNLATIQRAQQIDPRQCYCLLANHRIKGPSQFIRQHHLDGLHLKHHQPEAEAVERIWTVNRSVEMRQLFVERVAGIITDDFERAQLIRAEQHRLTQPALSI